MEFTATETIQAPRGAVLAALGDTGYYEHLATRVTTIEQPELLGVTVEEGVVTLSVSYAFAGEITGPAKMVIDQSKLTWVIHTTLDLATHRAVLDIVPDHYADLVVAEAEAHFDEHGETTVETVSGSLEVKIPLFGSSAERVIVDGLLRHLAAEAAALGEYVAARGS